VGGSFRKCSSDDWGHDFDRAGYAIRCLQELAGSDSEDPSLCSPLELKHAWLDADTYVAVVEAKLREARERWAVLLAALADRRLIARAAIKEMPLLMTITVEDERTDQAIALPVVAPLSNPRLLSRGGTGNGSCGADERRTDHGTFALLPKT
jgi:hypothetical protein